MQENRIKRFGKSAYDEANLSYTSIQTRDIMDEENLVVRTGRPRGMREAQEVQEVPHEVSQNTEPVPQVEESPLELLDNLERDYLAYLLAERDNDDWNTLMNKPHLSVALKKDSLYRTGVPFIKLKAAFELSQDLSLEEIMRILYDPETRLGWDKPM